MRIRTTAGIFLSMIVAHYTHAEMMKMNGAGNGQGDVCAGHWLGYHAGQHGSTLHPGGFVRNECYYYKHDGNGLGYKQPMQMPDHGLRGPYRIQIAV